MAAQYLDEKKSDVAHSLPERSMLRNVVIIGTVTLAQILTVGALLSLSPLSSVLTALQIANVSVVSISLPTIGRDLDIAESNLQWLVSAFSLSAVSPPFAPPPRSYRRCVQGCLLLFLGRAADLYGRKRGFILGCACMGIFGLGCGFAQGTFSLARTASPPRSTRPKTRSLSTSSAASRA